jgi:hypothetical protein
MKHDWVGEEIRVCKSRLPLSLTIPGVFRWAQLSLGRCTVRSWTLFGCYLVLISVLDTWHLPNYGHCIRFADIQM